MTNKTHILIWFHVALWLYVFCIGYGMTTRASKRRHLYIVQTSKTLTYLDANAKTKACGLVWCAIGPHGTCSTIPCWSYKATVRLIVRQTISGMNSRLSLDRIERVNTANIKLGSVLSLLPPLRRHMGSTIIVSTRYLAMGIKL